MEVNIKNNSFRFTTEIFYGEHILEALGFDLCTDPLRSYMRPQYYHLAKKRVGEIVHNWFKSPLTPKIKHPEYAMLLTVLAYNQAIIDYNLARVSPATKIYGLVITDNWKYVEPVGFLNGVMTMRNTEEVAEWREFAKYPPLRVTPYVIQSRGAKQLVDLVRRV